MSLKDYFGEKILWKLGPFGSESGGESFDDGAHSTVRQLLIAHDGVGVGTIQIEYDVNGISFRVDKHGDQTGSDHIDTIKLDYPYEYLISVHGRYCKFWPLPTVISSLTFRSNKKSYGPYGKEDQHDKYFSIQAPGNMIVGFHGRASGFKGIRAIGAYLKPIDHHYQNGKYNLDVMPALPKPSNPLRQARYPSQTVSTWTIPFQHMTIPRPQGQQTVQSIRRVSLLLVRRLKASKRRSQNQIMKRDSRKLIH